MVGVGAEPGGGVAVAQLVERRSFPRVFLPVVVGELDGGQAGGEAAEQPAGIDLWKLVMVTGEHDLRAGVLGVVEEGPSRRLYLLRG